MPLPKLRILFLTLSSCDCFGRQALTGHKTAPSGVYSYRKTSNCRLGVFGLGKVRLRIALPVTQLLIGIVAFYANHQFSWVFFSDYKGPPTPRALVLAKLALSAKVFCMGVSAPALLFWFFG